MLNITLDAIADHWLKLVSFMLILLSSQVHGYTTANITLVHTAVSKGAVCLDGSPPAYYYDQGTGQGACNWILYLEGCGWCHDETECIRITSKQLGNSSLMPNQTFLGGILNSDQTINPDFYNWNRVFIKYCDGASFSADVEQVNPKNNLHLRGKRIFNSIVEDLLEKGLKDAEQAILSGNSAGGLATMLHCDTFRATLFKVPKVKCLADSGFFIHAKNLPGLYTKREQPFAKVVEFHGLNKTMNQACMSRMDANLCLFPENFIEDIQTPLFLVNSAFDKYQLSHMVVPEEPVASWDQCKNGTKICSPAQQKSIKDFHTTFRQTLPTCPGLGLFIDGCYVHDYLLYDNRWNGSHPVNNKTIMNAVGDWFFDRSCSGNVYIDTGHDFPYQCRN